MNLKKDDLTQKIGQMIVLGFQGTDQGEPAGIEHILDLAEKGYIGGVIFYGYNIIDAKQLESVIRQLLSVPTPHPLFIFVDQEGGMVQRLNKNKGFRDFYSAKYVATHCSLKQAFEYYYEMGQLLNSSGFNFDFAPCVDLDYNARCDVIGGLDRSYGDDPQIVTAYAEAMIDGLEAAGIRSCLKHYPGHGNAFGDSHKGMVDATATWQERELEPYRQLITKEKVDAIMTAHIIHNDVDPGKPATISRIWLDRLRKELSFDGIIISDDLHMGAILQNYGLDEAVISGIKFGLDIIMFSNNPLAAQGVKDFQPDTEVAEKTIRTVRGAIQNGILPESRIEDAYRRIIRLKGKL